MPARSHGEAHVTPEHDTWKRMRGRVLNPSNPKYYRYGARGIKICPEWDEYDVFLRDMGRRPSPTHSLDRIDNNGDYCPANCRWATPLEQANNQSHTRFLTYGGLTLSVNEWARRTGIGEATIRWRLKSGKSVEESLTRSIRRAA